VNVEEYVPLESPYSYHGTTGAWDHEVLQRAFAKAGRIEVDATEERRISTAFFGLSVGGASSPVMGGGGSLTLTAGAFPDVLSVPRDVWTLKVTKVGVLSRKDETAEGGKKASSRKWKEWSVVLTGSQLLFFRDPSWATGLLAESTSTDGQAMITNTSLLRPDELLSVKDAVAVFDRSYNKVSRFGRIEISILTPCPVFQYPPLCHGGWSAHPAADARRTRAQRVDITHQLR
jgi:hypothetical protein